MNKTILAPASVAERVRLATWSIAIVLAVVGAFLGSVPSAWAASDLVIYDNAVSSAFTDTSFSFSSSNPCDTALYVSAPCSYAIAYQGWGGLSFTSARGDINTATYASIDWNLYANGQPVSDFSVLFDNTRGWSNEIVLSAAYVTQTLPGGWVHISVPVTTVNPTNQRVSEIQLKNALNRNLATIHVDDVRLAVSSSGYSLAAAPATQTVTAGGSTTYTITATAFGGFKGSIALSASGLPAGATAAFNPTTLPGSGQAVMTVTTKTSTPAGNSSIIITGTSGSITQTATATLTVNSGTSYSLSVTPASQSVAAGGSAPYTVAVAAPAGLVVTLSASGLPAGASAAFNPAAVTGNGTSTMTIATSANTPSGSSSITVTGANGGTTHSAAPVTLTVTGNPNFSITSDGKVHTGRPGATVNFPLTVNYTNGFSGTVSLTASGLPSGATDTITPSSVTKSGTAVLAVVTSASTPTGTSTLTVTATSGSITHTVNVTLVLSDGIPLISGGVPAFASSEIYPASYANDTDYSTQWRGTIPGWIAYDLSGVAPASRSSVAVAWYNDPTTADYDHTLAGEVGYDNLAAYTIEGNTGAGGGNPPTSGWVALVAVSGNKLHSRQHVLNFAGYNWIRLNVSASDGSTQNTDAVVNLDVYDGSGILSDDWIFFGDSITAGSMSHETTTGNGTFSQMINAARPANYPLQEGGGTSYLLSGDGAKYVPGWLKLFPGKYVPLSYGTNDALGCVDPATFYANYVTMVNAVIAAGKTPLVPHIPWGRDPNIKSCAPPLNAQIDNLYAAFPQIIRGPDLWAYFQNNPSLISGDGIHPNDNGMSALRQQWANTALTSVY